MTDVAATPAPPAPAPAFTLFDFWLYSLTVFGWSTSWIALKLQVGVVAPEVSVAWRFMIAALAMAAWMKLSGRSLAFPLKAHRRFLLQGLLIFSTNFYLFYLGSQYLASGLLSVVFSLASVVNLVLGALVLGQRIEPRVALGALIGFGGIGLVFWPEIVGTELDANALKGLGLCALGTLFFCSGNMMAASNARAGLPLLQTNTWGMVYGAVWMAMLALLRGQTFTVDFSATYLVGLFWLAIVSSVGAFAGYLTLLSRIGAARAGYATVIFPIFALAISTVFEDYHWTLLSVLGIGAVAAGNIVVLTRSRR